LLKNAELELVKHRYTGPALALPEAVLIIEQGLFAAQFPDPLLEQLVCLLFCVHDIRILLMKNDEIV
jgi:hypothetical protein